MSEMSVQMALSLVDAATPGLRTFATLIDGLGPKVTGLANRFTTLERNLSRVGSAADQAAPKVDKFSTSMTKLESTSQSVEAIMGNLPTVLSAFTAALQAALAVVTQASNGLNALSGSARTASGNIQGATNNLNQMGNAVNNVQKQVVSLNGVMEGFAARWASMKIFEGGKAIVDEAAQFQLVQKRIEALNLPNGQSAQINSDAEATAKRLGISVRDGLETYMAAIAGLAVTDYSESKKVIADTLDNAIKAAIVLRLRGDTSSVQDITRNLYGLIDARGQTHDAEAANRTIDLVQKNNAATGGKLTTKDLETISRQLKNGIGATVSDDGLLEIWAFASALKASGKGGGGGGMGVSQAGTAATQVAKWGLAGIHNKDSIRALQAMGLVDYGAAKGDSSTTMDNIGPGALKNSEMAVKAPIGFLMEMAPYALALAMKNKDMFAKGQDVTTPEGMKTALTEVALALFKNVNQANMAVQAWLPETATRIRSEVQQTKNAKGNQAAFDDVDKTYVRNTEKFTAAVHTLEVTLGNGLLPIITPIVEKLGEFLAFLNGVAAAHPTAATLTEVALGFLGVAGSIFALQKMFGIFTLMGTMVKGLGEAMGLMGAPTAAGATAAAGGLKILGIGLKGILGWVGLLWILYDVLLVVFDTKVWGVSIGNWFSG